MYLHVSGVSLQLFPELVPAQLVHIQYGVFPLYLLHAVRIVGHVLADLDLAQGVPVAPVGAFKLLHQVQQCSERQRLEHEVLSPTHAKRTETPPAVNAKHNVVEVVP